MNRHCLQRHVLTGQGGLVSIWKRVGLDQLSRKNYLVWEWWDTGTGCPEKLWAPHAWKCRVLAKLCTIVHCLGVHGEHFCMWITLSFVHFCYQYCGSYCSFPYLIGVSSEVFFSQPVIFTFCASNSQVFPAVGRTRGRQGWGDVRGQCVVWDTVGALDLWEPFLSHNMKMVFTWYIKVQIR